jgi:hypothetical protein
MGAEKAQATEPDDDQALCSQSRSRKTPFKPYHPDVVTRILDLRNHYPEAVPRVLGAPTILYYWTYHGKALAA